MCPHSESEAGSWGLVRRSILDRSIGLPSVYFNILRVSIVASFVSQTMYVADVQLWSEDSSEIEIRVALFNVSPADVINIATFPDISRHARRYGKLCRFDGSASSYPCASQVTTSEQHT